MQLPPAKAALTILTLAALFRAPDLIPAFKNYKVLDWAAIPSVLDFVPRRAAADPVEEEQRRLRPDTNVERAEARKVIDAARDLDHFYSALLRIERRESGAVVRILHYGDSPTTADMITADVRALLQRQFGDAGHGFVLIAKPWEWYGHRGIELQGEGWQIDPANQPSIHDGLFGLGGVSFRSLGGGVSRIVLRDPTHTRAEVAYLGQPGAGSFMVFADGVPLGTVDTSSSATKGEYAAFALPAGTRAVSIGEVRGNVRMFGIRFEKDGPGIEYNSLGLNGGFITVLAKFFDEDHWAAQLRHYNPDLVIVNYGTNESVYQRFVDTAFEDELALAIGRIRKALPECSILLMSPMDRGTRMSDGEIGTVPALLKVVAAKQRVAAREACAFFNTFDAMGGAGTMGRWYAAEPRLVGADFIHPMPAGAKIVGNLLYKALLSGYNEYKANLIKERMAVLPRQGAN